SLALLLAAALLAHYLPSLRGSALAALLSVLAILTKQTSAVVCVFIGIALLLRSPRRGLTYASVGAALGLGSCWWLEPASQGWFSFYFWGGPQGHAFPLRGVLLSSWRDLLVLCPFVLLVPTLGPAYARRARWLALPALAFWSVALFDRVRLLYEPLN